MRTDVTALMKDMFVSVLRSVPALALGIPRKRETCRTTFVVLMSMCDLSRANLFETDCETEGSRRLSVHMTDCES